jgi:hypothetical protein
MLNWCPEHGEGAAAGAGRSPAPLPPLTLFYTLITVQRKAAEQADIRRNYYGKKTLRSIHRAGGREQEQCHDAPQRLRKKDCDFMSSLLSLPYAK